MANNFCISCGTKLPANAKFCPECGTKVESITEPEYLEPTAESIAEPEHLKPAAESIAGPEHLKPAAESYSVNHLTVRVIDGSYWYCPYCRCRNSSSTNKCDNCNSQVDLSIEENEAVNVVSKWTCSFCGQVNNSEDSRCFSCGTSFSTKNWRCPSCGTLNGLSYSVCYVCGFDHDKLKIHRKANLKPDANAASSLARNKAKMTVYAVGDVFPYWICPECGSKNTQQISRCQNCNTEVNVVQKEISKSIETKNSIQQEHKNPSCWFIIGFWLLGVGAAIRGQYTSSAVSTGIAVNCLGLFFSMIIYFIFRRKMGTLAVSVLSILLGVISIGVVFLGLLQLGK